jgi:hypothetical protein
MMRQIQRIPWFVAAPAVVAVAAGVAVFSYMFTADLFHETCANDRNLLTGEFEASNCGEGAKVARQQADKRDDMVPVAMTETATPAGTAETPAAATPTVTPTPAATATSGVLAAGVFQDGDPGHDGEGIAEIQRLPDGSFNVFLKEFSVTNGPDLFVVLSTDPGGQYRDGDLVLSDLRANNGNQNYAIPAGTDVSGFRSVIIWCRQFDVVFAYAILGETP